MTSASSSRNSLLTRVFDIVVFRLPQYQAGQRARLDLGSEDFPERGDDVLGCRGDALHERNIEIEVLVIDAVDDLALDDFLQLRAVVYVTRLLVDLALNGTIERIVVTVPVRIVALPEEAQVLGFGELGIMNAMRGIEPHATSDCYTRHV